MRSRDSPAAILSVLVWLLFVKEILVILFFFFLSLSLRRFLWKQVATIAWFEADSVCGSHSVAIPLVLVLPYLFRLFQCLRQYKDTGEKTTLLNGMLTWPLFLNVSFSMFFSGLKFFPQFIWTCFFSSLEPQWHSSMFLRHLENFGFALLCKIKYYKNH